jgi:hypothetical protein
VAQVCSAPSQGSPAANVDHLLRMYLLHIQLVERNSPSCFFAILAYKDSTDAWSYGAQNVLDDGPKV